MVDVASKCIEIGFNSVDVRHEQGASHGSPRLQPRSWPAGCVCFASLPALA